MNVSIESACSRDQHFSLPHGEWSTAVEIIYWAAKRFRERLVVTSSFQTQSVPLLHLISRICPNVPVLFLDTGFHFEETLTFKDRLKHQLGLNVLELQSLMGHEQFRKKYAELYSTNPNMCCYLNKVEPLQRMLAGFDAWISGIRRDQTGHRADTPVTSKHPNGLIKVCPMVNWSDLDIAAYIDNHSLPRHPLHLVGYHSIGCACCTRPVAPGEETRAGRWSGKDKTECGLHDRLSNMADPECEK